ncbi:GntP family permease [Halomonas sp. MCCC 1A11036]|uniref:GntP family permease n=1 Tax=Billgrantia zhangzhouensis TaxID=2733481 RepID=A0ABS9AIN8_9GAMM|nr:GntP family permease [Halomonas zhangzhouensis]MCE8021603.1 GntP family permease [Halomonas zhangzhouensis]
MFSTIMVFLAGIIALLVLVGKFRLSAFLGLLTAAMVIGVLSGLGPSDSLGAIQEGFSGTILDIGLVIIFGTMLGKLLEASGATTRISFALINVVGKKLSSLGMAISGYIISIPVFSDAAFVMLSPLVRSVARNAKQHRAVIGVSLASGLLATNVFFPPTPGPLAAAALLDIDIGKVMIFGGILAIIYTVFGWGYAHFFLARKPKEYFVYDNELPAAHEDDELLGAGFEEQEATVRGGNKQPAAEGSQSPREVGQLRELSAAAAFLPLAVPLFMILLNTLTTAFYAENSGIVEITSFIGDPTMALVIGVIVSALVYHKHIDKGMSGIINSSLSDAGPIVFIVAAGGALAAILRSSGVGESLANSIVDTGMPFILVPFTIAAIIKLINGSGTTSLITTVTICAPPG